jgi:N4-gp56 family major capsid protein
MAMQTTSTAGITPQYQKYLDKQLLEHALPILSLAPLGQQRSLPRNKGAKTIRFHRRNSPDRTQVQTLSEGVPISNFREITLTAVDATLELFGEAAKISDLLSYTDLFDTMEQSVQLMGEDAASQADFHCMETVVPNINASNKRYAGGHANFAALAADNTATADMTIKDVLGAMTRLTLTRAPKPKGGQYVMITPPQVAYDIMEDQKFVDAGVRGTIKGLFNGELGVWYFTRIILTTQPWIESAAENTYDSAGTIFTSLVLGREAFGVPNLAGFSPLSPSMIINEKPDKSDPLGQFVVAGWKLYWTAVVLNDLWAVALRTKSSYVG